MKTSQLLKQAKFVIEKEKNWCQKDLAKTVRNVQVSPQSIFACKFCSLGALIKITGNIDLDIYLDRVMDNNTVIFNDTHTHAEVMQAWDKAIKLAEADENS